MGKRKRKLTRAEKAEKKRKRELYMTIFVGGKMKRVLRPPTVEGVPVEDFIAANADPIWLHMNEMWEDLPIEETRGPVGPIVDYSVDDCGEELAWPDEPPRNDGEDVRILHDEDDLPF